MHTLQRGARPAAARSALLVLRDGGAPLVMACPTARGAPHTSAAAHGVAAAGRGAAAHGRAHAPARLARACAPLRA